jgi:diketogulonate reductase-like aldo/keto reductase
MNRSQFDLTAVQRGNTVIPKSSTEKRIKSNFEVFELDKEDFEAIEGIAGKVGQKRFGDLDALWGSSLFANESL